MKLLVSIFLFAFFVSPFSSTENKSFTRERSFDVQHYVMRLSFDRKKKIVFGDSSIRLKPLNNGFRILELDSKSIKFSSIKLESNGTELSFKTSKNKVTISLDKDYKAGELIKIRLKYKAKPKKGIYFVDELRRKGKTLHSSQIWTQGESEETHHWLPSFDSPNDKATTEQIITIKTGETVIGNGKLLKTSKNTNGTTTFHYKMSVPHSLYLTSFVVGKYEKISDRYKDIPLGFYVYPGQKALVSQAYGKTKDMFRIFEELTGVEYPYAKYDQTMVANFSFGGMENITATTMSDTEIMFAKTAFGKGLVENLVAHELAHSWFGNLVTHRNWAELWLNESFATYMEAAYREKMYGRNEYISKILQDAGEYFGHASNMRGNQHGLFNITADAKNDSTMFDSITYQKGSAVIHTLREEIGDNAFWKGVNIYLNRHKFKNVETSNLQKAFEDASDKDLEWFFKQWVYAEGFPKLKIAQSYDPNSKILNVMIEQLQKADKDTPGTFILPMSIDVKTEKGTQTKSVKINKRAQIFSFKLNSKPIHITLDKERKIPLKSVEFSKKKLKLRSMFSSLN